MRKACITITTHEISRFLRMNLEGLMLELRWEVEANQRAFLAREIAFNLFLQLRYVKGVLPRPRNMKDSGIMYNRLKTAVRDALPGDTTYLSALAPKSVARQASDCCRLLKVEARRGRLRVGVCVLLSSRDLEPLMKGIVDRKVCNVSLVVPVVTTLGASKILARLAGASSTYRGQHG